MTTAGVLFCAMILDAVLGEPDWLWQRFPHPAVLMGRLIAALEKALNHGKARKVKGAIGLFLLIVISLIISAACAFFGPVAEIIVAAILLAQKSLVEHVKAVSTELRQSLSEGRVAVSNIVSRDTSEMHEAQIARAAIESAAENLSDGVVAPAVWFLIGGLPGLVIYKMVNTADSMIGYRTARYAAFGWASARADDVMNLIPARLTAALIALSSWQLNLAAIRSDAIQHRSPNAGWPEAAMSRALDIALSGPRAYDGTMRDYPWVNAEGKRDLTSGDIDASIFILWKAWALMIALVALFGILTF